MPFQKGHKPYGTAVKGAKQKKTLEKEVQLKYLQQEILKEIRPLLRAGLDSARGLTIMYQRKKVKVGKEFKRQGELVQVNDQNRVEQLLRGDCTGEDWYYITTKDQNIQALKELLERVFGKVQDKMDITSGDKPIPLLYALHNNNSNKENIATDQET